MCQESDWFYHQCCTSSLTMDIKIGNWDWLLNHGSWNHHNCTQLPKVISNYGYFPRTRKYSWIVNWVSYYDACFDSRGQCWSTGVGWENPTSIYSSKQVLRNEDGLILWRDPEIWNQVTENWYHLAVGRWVYQRITQGNIWIPQRETDMMVIASYFTKSWEEVGSMNIVQMCTSILVICVSM